ncbi:hypothetical protein L7F22_067654 [Adiantum nelumboides]|nr:hypothetical protein [Adiantum nelumboides]
MGNKLARTTQGSASEYYLHDLPSTCNLVLKEPLGGGRFLKSILCLHDEGLVVVKVYFKRGEFPDLKEHERKLQHLREQLIKVEQSHVWPFQYWLETDKAAYLLRQYFFSNLHDRISTRPFLLKQSHERGICHGDIKCENVVVTSWNWLYLTDYASFKPTFLPVDNPADFSFFFDTGGRRRCYVAPERFFEPGGDVGNILRGLLTPAMDIFSVGCVIAELFMEGQALFDLSQLLAYRRGQYDPCPSLQKVVDIGVRDTILHMIQLDPTARLTAEQYLQSWAPCVFPAYFSPLLHSFFSCLLPLDIDTRVAVTHSAFPELCKQMIESSSPDYKEDEVRGVDRVQDDTEEEVGSAEAKQSWHTSNVDATLMWRFKAAAVVMEKASMKREINAVTADAIHQRDIHRPIQVLENKEHSSQGDPGHGGKCEGMVLIGSLLCASIRNVKLPQARRGAVQMLYKSCLYIDDESRLQQVLPYVVALLSDPAAIVRCVALQVVCNLLSLVETFPPSDSKIFPEYIIPLLSMLPDDSEESVRICYADNIHKLAQTAHRFLESSHYMTEIGVLDKSVQSVRGTTKKMAAPSFCGQNGSRYMLELSQLRETIARVIQELVMGQKQTPNIRRALLHHLGQLCEFFGTRQCNDVLLPILPAFLNDRDEQLRAVFFEQIVYVCLFVGQTSIESYLLPYIEQALSDVEETVIVNALECLAAICVHRLVRKRVLLRAVERCAPLLCHPSQWVRRSALTVVASAGANLELVDSHAFLLPILAPFVRREPVSLNLESALSACLKTPMSREMFNRVLSDAMLSQTTPQKLESKNRSKQKAVIANIPLGTSSRKTAAEQQKAETQTYDIGSASLVSPVLHGDRLPFTEMDDNEKMKAMEGYIRNLSSTMQSRMHNWEVDNSEKLQSSVIGENAGVGAGFYTNYDGSSDGIPLYSLPLSERRGDSQISSSLNEDWSGVIAVRHGTQPFHITALSGTSSILPTVTASHWAEGASTGHEFQKQQAVLGSKFVSGSSFTNAIGTRQAYEISKDAKGGDTDADYAKTLTVSRLRDNLVPEVSFQGALELPGTGGLRLTEANNLQASSPSFVDNQWQPCGVLIAHLQEHHRAVNKVVVSHDNNFFVSASDDGNIKFWDCRRLESNISFRSRLTYCFQGAKALGVCMIGNSPQVAAASSTGKIHVLRVDYVARVAGSVERYSGLTDVRNLETQEGAVVSLLNYSPDGPPMLLYTTQRNGIHLWDLRLQKDAWCLRAKPSQGYVSATALASCYNWLVTGSSRGVLTLWDLRFQLPVNTWCHPSSSLVESTSTVLPPSEFGAASTSRAYVYVAAGRDEVALWNAADGSCQQVLRLNCDPTDLEFSDIPTALPRRRPAINSELKRIEGSKKSDYKLEELNEPSPRVSGVRALLPLPGGGGLLMGGTDCKVRMWDRLRPERSYCVCGPVSKTAAALDNKYDSRVIMGVQVMQEMFIRHQGNRASPRSKRILATAATETVGCHRDSILSLAAAQTTQHLLISSSRDGSIKVWR